VFAVLAFGGVALVLFSAPPNGDVSLEGNVFGLLAMVLLVGYVVSTQYLQFVLGHSPSAAGVRVLPYAAAMIGFAPLSSRLVLRPRDAAGRDGCGALGVAIVGSLMSSL
jgi:drug/metabolite transporter (DMT)-like permease